MDASNLAIVFSMSFIDQENLSSGMGPILGGIQTVLQHFIRELQMNSFRDGRIALVF